MRLPSRFYAALQDDQKTQGQAGSLCLIADAGEAFLTSKNGQNIENPGR